MTHLKALRPIALAVMLAVATGAAHADEREAMETLRQTTLNLISALVETGVLTREKASELIREAELKAARTVAQQREKEGVVATVPGTVVAPAPVRVQYIPESVKAEIRDQIRKEVLNQAREEHWADRNAVPSWLDRVKVSGDVLTRYQFDDYVRTNTLPRDYDQATTFQPGMVTRNAAFADTGQTEGNTRDDRSRARLRVRLGIDAKVSDAVRTEVRIASGSSGISTTQTMGSNFNKYSLWLDRGFIRYEPLDWANVQVGRMSNPFVSSDLVWDDSINFDGLALGFKDKKADGFVPYMTAGAFPLASESAPKTPYSRTLLGAQLGASTDVSNRTRARFGVAYYNFKNLEGHVESRDNYTTSVGPRSDTYANTEYPSTMRQTGNSLVRINAENDPNLSKWGLASRFAPLHIGFGFDNARSDALHLVFSADYVKNMAFDRNEIQRRTSVTLTDGRSTGHQVKFLVGAPAVRKKGEWNGSVAFRSLGSDAVPDAFADGTLGGGGTNVRGYILGFNYGLDAGTSLGFKYLSGRNIDSPSMLSGSHTIKVNTFQLDLGVSF